ncbi:MAG: DUF29 domain-containing protein [Leptolyngbyaceae cyanobacterium SM2_5_2]|nr:DUF29 domain-containing protein [Leptolyngbyaceae cyanobacterium SM2_5_2]
MTAETNLALVSLYDTDYQLWLDQTVAQLRLQDFATIDLENLIEELESLGKRDRRAVASYLLQLCEHLLKIKYWDSERDRCFRGWDREIASFRLQIQAILTDSPSLRRYLNEIFEHQYTEARQLFLKSSGVTAHLIPDEPCFSLEQVLAKDWLP